MRREALDELIVKAAAGYGYHARMDTLLEKIAPARSPRNAADPNDVLVEAGYAKGVRDADRDYDDAQARAS